MSMPSGQQGGYGFQGGSPNASSGGGGFGQPPGNSYGGPPQGSFGPSGGGYAPTGGYNTGAGGGYGDMQMKSASGSGSFGEVFFAAACCVVAGALFSGFNFAFTLKVVDWLLMTYLLLFGTMLAVLDTPCLSTIKTVTDAKLYIGKYLQFITRLTGKGITLVFLGSALFMSMWDNLTGGMWMFLAVVLSILPVIVGLGGVGWGLLKSSKLEKARRQLELVINDRFDQYAQTFRGPTGGLTMDEFNRMTATDYGIHFDYADLKLIFNALCSNPVWKMQAMGGSQGGQYQQMEDGIKLTKDDLTAWSKGGMVFL